jgi:uncharacterized protein
VSLGLAGCAVSDPTQFYALSRETPPRSSTASASIAMTGMDATSIGGIGVGPVIMPGYLDRNQIVLRTGADKVEISTFHRWAEPLEDGIIRVLAEEIAARVPTERVVMFPWRGVVTLDTRWRILASNGSELGFRRSTVIQGVEGSGYEPMIAAMGRALGILGQEIAAEIRALPRDEDARR